jgi:DNA-binding GntR family transcriptional regulator
MTATRSGTGVRYVDHLYATGMEAEAGMAAGVTAKARGGAKDRALDYVKSRILSGAFRGGELISEGEVARALEMSRTPVREAFLRLEAEGLLRLYPQRGALVVPVSPEEIRAVIEARLVLEQFAAQKVIRRAADIRVETADSLAEELVRQRRAGDAGDLPEFLDADRLFHATLLDSAQNSILGAVYASLRDRQVRMIGESALRDPRRVDTILAEHERIAAAVRNGDVEEALEAIRVHLTGTARALGLALETGSVLGSRSDAR